MPMLPSMLSIGTKSKIRGHHKGSHRSQRFGASLDFSDFREYYPGDDVRQIDWNVFARTDKYFIKRFLDEQEAKFSPSVGNRFVFVHPIVDLEELLHVMEPYRGSIGCAALAVTPEQSVSTARTMALWGIPRITSTGMMHRPCIFKEGGMPGLGELTYKAFWEKKYSE